MSKSHSNRLTRPLFAATLLLGAVLAVGSPSLVRAQTSGGGTEPPDNEPVYELASLNLVTFQIGALSRVRAIGVPELGEVYVGEEVPAGGDERFLIYPTLPPVQLFARLAPKDSPVPRMIADLDREGLLAGRPIVETIDVPIQVSPSLFGIRGALTSVLTKAGGGSCQSGNAGKDYFESHHCNSDGGPGYGGSESYCDSTADWDWIQRSSASTRRATYSRMASCGSGTNRLRHSYYYSGWHTQLTVYVPAQQIAHWWSYKNRNGIKLQRRTRFDNENDTGWVRGWSKFWSEVAGGW